MDTTWGLFAQIPLAALFAYFIITFQRQNSANVIRNHEEWRDWLNKQQESSIQAAESQQLAWMESVNRINERHEALIAHQEARDDERSRAELEHRRRMIAVLERLDERSHKNEMMITAMYLKNGFSDTYPVSQKKEEAVI